MAINRSQFPELMGYQEGGLISSFDVIDPFDPDAGFQTYSNILDSEEKDTGNPADSQNLKINRAVNAQVVDSQPSLLTRLNDLQSALTVKDEEASSENLSGKTYEQRFNEYKALLNPVISGEKRRRNPYDFAAALGQGLLSADPTAGAFVGLGLGFNIYNQQIKKQQETLKAEQRAIALKAFELAREDEQAALDFINKKEIEKIKNATTKQKFNTWIIPERDESGVETGNFIKRSAADTDLATQEFYSSLGGYPATGGDTFNLGDTAKSEFSKNLGKKGADAVAKWEEEATLAINQRNLLRTAEDIMKDIPYDDVGILQDLTLPARKLLTDLGILKKDDKIKDQELVKSFGTRIAMGLIGQTKGAISNAEMTLFLASSPGLAMTKDGYIELIGYLDRINQKQIDFKTAFDQAMVDGDFDEALKSGDDVKISSAIALWQKTWHADNPLFDKSETERLQTEYADKEDPTAKKFRENYLRNFGDNNKKTSTGDDVSDKF